MMLVKNKPHKCELFNVSHHFIYKMCWLGGWPSKICVAKLNNFLTNCLGNLSSGWLELNIFIPRFWVYNYGGWQGRWLTQEVIFKPPKWVYLNQIYKGFLWNLTNKWKLFIMSTFLGGWHLLKWVKKWLTLEMSSSLIDSCKDCCYHLDWIMWAFFHNSTKKFCSQFNLVADILTLIKHASALSIQMLYFSNIFIHWKYYLSLLVKL